MRARVLTIVCCLFVSNLAHAQRYQKTTIEGEKATHLVKLLKDSGIAPVEKEGEQSIGAYMVMCSSNACDFILSTSEPQKVSQIRKALADLGADKFDEAITKVNCLKKEGQEGSENVKCDLTLGQDPRDLE